MLNASPSWGLRTPLGDITGITRIDPMIILGKHWSAPANATSFCIFNRESGQIEPLDLGLGFMPMVPEYAFFLSIEQSQAIIVTLVSGM